MEVVGAFVGCEAIEQAGDALPEGFAGALPGATQQGFELGEELLDRIEVGRIGREEDERGAALLDGAADGAVNRPGRGGKGRGVRSKGVPPALPQPPP